MNKKQKGNKVELELKKLYESLGYLVMRSPRTMRPIGKGRYISQDNDFFNLFDLCCKQGENTHWIQVKSNPNHVYTCKQEISNFQKKFCSIYEFCQIVLKVPRKGYVAYGLNNYDCNWYKLFYDLKLSPTESFKITGDKK